MTIHTVIHKIMLSTQKTHQKSLVDKEHFKETLNDIVIRLLMCPSKKMYA